MAGPVQWVSAEFSCLWVGATSHLSAPLADKVTWNSSCEAVRWQCGGHGALRPKNLFLALGVLTLQKLILLCYNVGAESGR